MYLKLTKDGVFKGRLFAMTSVSPGSKVQYCFKNSCIVKSLLLNFLSMSECNKALSLFLLHIEIDLYRHNYLY